MDELLYNPYDPQGIKTDVDAESAVVWLRERQEERDRLIATADEMILKYEAAKQRARDAYERDTEVTVNNLASYAKEHVTKSTKTMQKTILPTASLVWKIKEPKVERDENALKAWAKQYAPQFIEQTILEKTKWAEMKKTLQEVGGGYQYVTEDGEMIPVEGVTLIPQEDVFVIE